MAVDKQLSFAAGEVSPAIYGHADLQKFDSACRTLLNMFVHVEGGASNRPGLEFIGAVHDSSETTRLIRFRFNTEQTYVLEFSDYAFRVIKDGAYVLNSSVSITAISKADPVELTIGAHTLVAGQEVFVNGGDMVELTTGFYRINSVTATTITLEDIFGTTIDSSTFTTYTTGGTVEAIPIFTTPFAQADLALIKFTQNADVLTLTHPDWMFMYNITRTDHDVWTVAAITFVPGIDAPVNFETIALPTSGAILRDYKVTAIDDTTGEESVASVKSGANNDLSVAANRNNLSWSPVTNASKYNCYCDDSQSGVYGFVGESAQVSEDNAMSAATQANPCVITIPTHTYEIGQQVDIVGVTGMTELNGNTYLVNSVPGSTTISLKSVAGVPLDSTGFGVYTGPSGTATISLVAEFSDNFITPDYTKTPPETATPFTQSSTTEEGISAATKADPVELTIGAHTYVVDQQVDIADMLGMTGLNGNSYLINSVTVTTITLKSLAGVPVDSTSFGVYTSGGIATISESGDTPRCVTYHQQRRGYSSTDNKPSTFFMSRIGLFNNMNVSQITQADDAITYNVLADDVNEIRDMQSQKDLFLFTSSGVWRIVTGESLAFTADNISAEEQESWGVSDVRALKVGQSFLYVQDGERVVRDLQDTLESNGFSGDELTLLAAHLFKDRKIVEWAYARDPYSIVWCVMDDGTVNALTYLRKHQIWAWSHHTTDGLFKSVESIPENTREYGVYFVVERTINGSTMKYVERLHNRNLLDIKDSFFVDSGLSLDSPITISGATQADPVVITATAHGFSDGDLIDHSDITGMTELNNNRYKIANKTANTYELNDADDNTIDGTGFTAYLSGGKARVAVTTISGLEHLEGEDVSVLADGGTDANPNNSSLDTLTVSSGSITLTKAASRVHVGLPYISDLETIGVDLTSVNGLGDSLGKIKTTHAVNIRVQDTVGIRLGPNEDELEQYKPEGVDANQPQSFINDVIPKSFLPVWDRDATVFVRQLDPLPITILNILPEVKVVTNS